MKANRLLVPVVVLTGACVGQRHVGPRPSSPAPERAAAQVEVTASRGTGSGAPAHPGVSAPVPGGAGLVPCTEHRGNVLVCAGEQVEGLTVTAAGDGTFHRVAWRRRYGSDKRWRYIALYDTGLISFIVDPGTGDQRRWWTLSRWGFPRTQRITVARVPGTLRFEVTDFGGTVWSLVGTAVTAHHVSFAVESIAGQEQSAVAPARSARGIVGIDLGHAHPLLLEHRVASFSPYADLDAPAHLRMKSHFRDGNGTTCAVPNRALFGGRRDGSPRPTQFRFATDAELAEFLSPRCPSLDLAPLRDARPPAPVHP